MEERARQHHHPTSSWSNERKLQAALLIESSKKRERGTKGNSREHAVSSPQQASPAVAAIYFV